MSKAPDFRRDSTVSSHLLDIYRRIHTSDIRGDINERLTEGLSRQLPTFLGGLVLARADSDIYPRKWFQLVRESSIYSQIAAWGDVALGADDIARAEFGSQRDDGSGPYVQPYIGSPVSSFTGRVTDALIVNDELRIRIEREKNILGGVGCVAVARVIVPDETGMPANAAIHTQLRFER
ncbi:MAG: hypothetical protein WAS36_00875 [Candidatus Saccharimonadales bacterium]